MALQSLNELCATIVVFSVRNTGFVVETTYHTSYIPPKAIDILNLATIYGRHVHMYTPAFGSIIHCYARKHCIIIYY